MNSKIANKPEKLTNLEWLCQQIHAKTANYEPTTPSSGDVSINWEDRCGAIATFPTEETKAYASILVWGDYRDNTENYAVVTEYIADYLYRMVQEEMNKKRETFDLRKFCNQVARMGLFYSLRPQLKEYHTLKGRLVFSGIDYIEPNTYSKRYVWLNDAVDLLLKELFDEIDHYIGIYRKDLNKITA